MSFRFDSCLVYFSDTMSWSSSLQTIMIYFIFTTQDVWSPGTRESCWHKTAGVTDERTIGLVCPMYLVFYTYTADKRMRRIRTVNRYCRHCPSSHKLSVLICSKRSIFQVPKERDVTCQAIIASWCAQLRPACVKNPKASRQLVAPGFSWQTPMLIKLPEVSLCGG